MGSNHILPKEVIENISILLNVKIWVLWVLITVALSENVDKLLIYFKTNNEVVWVMIYFMPILVALVVVGDWCNGVACFK